MLSSTECCDEEPFLNLISALQFLSFYPLCKNIDCFNLFLKKKKGIMENMFPLIIQKYYFYFILRFMALYVNPPYEEI